MSFISSGFSTFYASEDAAFQAQQTAWDTLSAVQARYDALEQARDDAFDIQDQAWETYQALSEEHAPQLAELAACITRAEKDSAKADRLAAALYRSGKYHRAERATEKRWQQDQRRAEAEAEADRLRIEIQTAKQAHQATLPACEQARDDFVSCQDELAEAEARYDAALAEYGRVQDITAAALQEYNAHFNDGNETPREEPDEESSGR